MNEDVQENFISLFSKDELPISVQRQFIDDWQRVEVTLRTLEHYQGALFLPAYMGVRNAGRHLCAALSQVQDGDRASAEISLGRAVVELRRARHDALRLIVNYCHFKLLLIEEEFGTERIYQVYSKYFEMRGRIEDVNTRLNEDFSDIGEADAFFIELENEYLPKLLDLFSRMVQAKSVVLDGIKKKDEREERYKRLAVAGFGIGIFGVILAIVAVFIQ